MVDRDARNEPDLDDWFDEPDTSGAWEERSARAVRSSRPEARVDDWAAPAPGPSPRERPSLRDALRRRSVVVAAILLVCLLAGLAAAGVFSGGHPSADRATTQRAPATTATTPATTRTSPAPAAPTAPLKPGDTGASGQGPAARARTTRLQLRSDRRAVRALDDEGGRELPACARPDCRRRRRLEDAGRSHGGARNRLEAREPRADRCGDRVQVAAQAVVALHGDDVALRARRRHAERVAYALHDERGNGERSELREPRRRGGLTLPARRPQGKREAEDAAARVAAAVRQATRAPDERPPATSGPPPSSTRISCSTIAIHAVSSWCAGAGERRPATR